jgi:hypothetical protein
MINNRRNIMKKYISLGLFLVIGLAFQHEINILGVVNSDKILIGSTDNDLIKIFNE